MLGVNVAVAPARNKTPFIFDPDILSIYLSTDDLVRRYDDSMQATGMEWADSLTKRGRYFSLAQSVEHIVSQGIEGDVAECGCWFGHSAHMISGILADREFNGTFHIFDSFEGLSDLSPVDMNERITLTQEQIDEQAKFFACSEQTVLQNLSAFSFIRTYKGWIPERFHEIADKTFALVHLDVDLYQPYKDSIAFFYPRMSKGGIIAFDDYGLSQFPGAKIAVDACISQFEPRLFYRVPTGGAFLIV